MTPEQMERAIEFLLDHHARFITELEVIKEAQAQTSKNIADLTGAVASLTAQAETDREEIREAIENLILANEATRKFSEDIARLEVQTSQRVTNQGKEIALLIEQGKETSSQIAALGAQGKETSSQIAALIEQGKETSSQIAALIEQGKETSSQIAALIEQGKETSSQIAALGAQGKETDARLNALINIVERHITNTKAHEGEE